MRRQTASAVFELRWECGLARHTDITCTDSLNLWRDYLPPARWGRTGTGRTGAGLGAGGRQRRTGEDKYSARLGASDPLFAVWGRRTGKAV
jgi:hypothetical protein